MTVALVVPQPVTDNVIELSVVNGKLAKKEEVRYNKDGTIDKRKCYKESGVSSEVYAFTSNEEIEAMINVFNKHIDEAPDENKRQIAYRNKMLFLIGMNVGLRASDLRTLKYNFFFAEKEVKLENEGEKVKVLEWRDFYKIQPKKQRNQGKFVKLYFNQTVKKAITDYIDKYPVNDVNGYLFQSRKGNEPISEASLWRIIKDAAAEAGIEKNIGSHSLRKSFGFHIWHNAEDKKKALVTLQAIFNHSSVQTTMKYIGLLDTEIEDMFLSIDLGLEYL